MATDLTQQLLEEIEVGLQRRGFSSQTPQGLYTPIDYTLSLGGKRVRPLLCLLAARIFKDSYQEAIPIALALEIFHNFTLLHDDLMDGSEVRRGQPTVYRRWDSNTAILSGDAMSIEAYRTLEEIKDTSLLQKIFPRFNTMAIEVCKGQQYDMEFETRSDVSVAEYLEMIRLKTAVLLGASLRLGSYSAGASDEEADTLDQIGQHLGLAFQIQDDILDVYADKATFGKPIGGDIINAKKTLLLLYTQEQLKETTQGQKLKNLLSLSKEERTKRINEVKALYSEAGALQYATIQVQQHTQKAELLLDEIDNGTGRCAELRHLFDALAHRNK